MSEKEIAFLAEVDTRFQKQKSWYSSIIIGLIVGILTLGAANIAGVTSNKTTLQSVEEDVEDIKLYYVDVFMFRELMTSIQLYTDHMTAKLGGDEEAAAEVNKKYNELWNKILFDAKISATRGGSSDNSGTK